MAGVDYFWYQNFWLLSVCKIAVGVHVWLLGIVRIYAFLVTPGLPSGSLDSLVVPWTANEAS